MISSISPPTDNLYKFIAIFGLIIFLFSLYKSGEVFDNATENKIDLEDLKKEIQLSYLYSSSINEVLDTASVNIAPVLIKRMDDDLHIILYELQESELPSEKKYLHEANIKKLLVKNDALNIRITEFLVTLFLGVILMILGFILWYKKDQRLKDNILEKELEILKNKLSEITH